MKRWLWIALSGLMISVFSVISCGKNSHEVKATPKKVSRVQTAAVQLGVAREILETTGEAVAIDTVAIEATVEGPIGFCPWREGDHVEHGEKLVEIDRPLYRQEVAVAEAMLGVAEARLRDMQAGARPEEIAQAAEAVRHLEEESGFAKTDLDRVTALVTSGALPREAMEKAHVDYVKSLSELRSAREKLSMLEEGATATELDVARANVAEARARRDLAQARLEECCLRAPFDSVITRVHVRPGDLVAPRVPLLEMMNPDSCVVRFAVPEAHASKCGVGAEVQLSLDTLNGRQLRGVVERVYPNLEEQTRTRLCEARVLGEENLLPGTFARVRLSLRTVPEAVLVPLASLLTTPRGERMLFVVEQGKARQRIVKTGIEEERYVEILEGVAPGMSVVVAGGEKLRDGMGVEVIKQASTHAAAGEEDS